MSLSDATRIAVLEQRVIELVEEVGRLKLLRKPVKSETRQNTRLKLNCRAGSETFYIGVFDSEVARDAAKVIWQDNLDTFRAFNGRNFDREEGVVFRERLKRVADMSKSKVYVPGKGMLLKGS